VDRVPSAPPLQQISATQVTLILFVLNCSDTGTIAESAHDQDLAVRQQRRGVKLPGQVEIACPALQPLGRIAHLCAAQWAI